MERKERYPEIKSLRELTDRAKSIVEYCGVNQDSAELSGWRLFSDSVEICTAAGKIASEFNENPSVIIVKSIKLAEVAKILIDLVHGWFVDLKKYRRERSHAHLRMFSEILYTASRMLDYSAKVLRVREYLKETDQDSKEMVGHLLQASADLRTAANTIPSADRDSMKCGFNIYGIHSKYIRPVREMLDERVVYKSSSTNYEEKKVEK